MDNRDYASENLTELEEKVAEEVKLDVKCECEPNDCDDDSDKDARDMSNNLPEGTTQGDLDRG